MSADSSTRALSRTRRTGAFVLAGLVVALLLAGVVSYFASSDPDGLTKVAEEKGLTEAEKEHGLKDSPLADYSTRDVDNEWLSTAVAGVIGVVVTFAVAGGVTLLVRRRNRTAADEQRTSGAGAPGP